MKSSQLIWFLLKMTFQSFVTISQSDEASLDFVGLFDVSELPKWCLFIALFNFRVSVCGRVTVQFN